MVLAVSAYTADVTIEDGSLVLPIRGGNWFLAKGIPPGTPEWPMTPEDAAARSAASTRRRVAEVPMLIAPPYLKGRPQDARWRLTLDGPAGGSASSTPGVEGRRIYAWRPTGTGTVHMGSRRAESARTADRLLSHAVPDPRALAYPR